MCLRCCCSFRRWERSSTIAAVVETEIAFFVPYRALGPSACDPYSHQFVVSFYYSKRIPTVLQPWICAKHTHTIFSLTQIALTFFSISFFARQFVCDFGTEPIKYSRTARSQAIVSATLTQLHGVSNMCERACECVCFRCGCWTCGSQWHAHVCIEFSYFSLREFFPIVFLESHQVTHLDASVGALHVLMCACKWENLMHTFRSF